MSVALPAAAPKAPAVEEIRRRFEEEPGRARGPTWLQEMRAAAMERLEARGVPDHRTPGWEHTPTRPLWSRRAAPDKPGQLDPAVLERAAFQDEAARLVFVDGHFTSKLSRTQELPPGVRAAPLPTVWDSEAFRESQEAKLNRPSTGFTWLWATAFLQDGAFLHIPAGTRLEHPVHIVHVHTRPQTATSTRHVILGGKGSDATIVESWVGSAPDTLTLHSTELVAPQATRFRHIKQQLEHQDAVHLGRVEVAAGRDSQVHTFLLSEGGAWSRSETEAQLVGPGASCSADGLWLGRRSQFHDCPNLIDHQSPHTTSRQLWKGIMDDESHGVFLGNVIVRPDAQKVDSEQTNRNLLLSRKARVDTTPQLEIHADDVKCAHGSTIGRLDPDALFFLRARGIDAPRAELLLTKAFAGEVLSRVDSWGIRTRLERRLENWFQRRHP